MTIDINLIKRLRDMTGAGVADVKEALEEAKGDIEKAKDVLAVKGQKSAAKRTEISFPRIDRLLCSLKRKNRRIGGGELRNGFCGAHGRFSGIGP